MRQDQDIKWVNMIPAPRTTTANGQSVSAASYGTGGSTKGIADIRGYRRAVVFVTKQTGTAQKASVRLAFHSGSSTLFVSATPLTGTTSGLVLDGVTTSAICNRYVLDLTKLASTLAYMTAKVTTSTTSGNVGVYCMLTNAEQFPPSTTGFTTSTNYPT